ncbi:unnamed protein product [Cylindrotheca closterium]|uniref:Uncharacterized protein n=1 Tax=Cylindrotheca closterium TaxID=2856 RepID=A0AAD2JJA0_9STRA|nr:unnamed protein product [Cylindrotheca closterium]
MAMNAPPSIMQPHDPNDDPFGDLAPVDPNAPKLELPTEFGSGLKNVKEAAIAGEDAEDATEATHDESEDDDNKEEEPSTDEDKNEEDKAAEE